MSARIVRYDNGTFRIDLDERAAQQLVHVLVTIEQVLEDQDWLALDEMAGLRDAMIDVVPPPEDDQ